MRFDATAKACEIDLANEWEDVRALLVLISTMMVSAIFCLLANFTVGGILCLSIGIICLAPVINYLRLWRRRLVMFLRTTTRLDHLVDF